MRISGLNSEAIAPPLARSAIILEYMILGDNQQERLSADEHFYDGKARYARRVAVERMAFEDG